MTKVQKTPLNPSVESAAGRAKPAWRISAYVLAAFGSLAMVSSASAVHSIARDWDEKCLSFIRQDTPHPPAHARNLFSLSACLYDGWAAYNTNAVGFIFREKPATSNIEADRREAMSYAAYRMLRERYALSRTATNTLMNLDAYMVSLGYDTNNFTTNTTTAAGVGNSIYLAVSAWFLSDKSRQAQKYADYPPEEGGYAYVNPPLVTGAPGILIVDINRWQRLAITNAIDQNGFPMDGTVQNYLGAHWLGVRPFALTRTNHALPWIDPGPPPELNGTNDAFFRSCVVDMIRRSSELTPDDGVMIDISPGAFGNNSLGENDGTGHPLNPATGQPYASNIVKRGDFTRVLAEFWADGPNSETPPGHWNVVANEASDYPGFIKRIGGIGPVVDDLEWDVKLYFTLNAATHDAACAAWGVKRYYDGWRPMSAVRYMGQNGQSTYTNDVPGGAAYSLTYHPDGLPIVPGLIEQVTPLTSLIGPHFDLTPGKIAIKAWPGQPDDSTNTYSGVKWVHADNWITYQKKTFVTPGFPGYISGHSTFSRAAAEVLAAFTGSPFFPGGLGVFNANTNYLTFERGPSQPIQLQWGTYYDAADQAGLSRIWGGIHPTADDLPGRRTGSQAGLGAWSLAQKYFNGTITNTPIAMTHRRLNQSEMELRYETLRGFRHELQSTGNLNNSFTNEPGGSIFAGDTSVSLTNNITDSGKFFRVRRVLTP